MKAMRWMLGAMLLCIAAAANAVPSFTPMIDGVKDAGWGNTPDHLTNSVALNPNTFNLDSGLYVTDDAEWVYFGYWADNDPWADAKSVHVHILIDVGSTAGGGTFACWGASNVFYGMTYKPEYDLVMQWNTDNQNASFTGLNTWQFFSWVQQPEITTDAGGGSQWTEVGIRKNQIGTPAQGAVLNLSMWLRPAWDSQGGVACLPAQANFPSDNGATGASLTVQFPYTIQHVFGDAIAPRLLSAHQIDRDRVELLFNEPMDPIRLNNTGFYNTAGTWPLTGVESVTGLTSVLYNSGDFVTGNLYTIMCSANIRDAAGNPIDPAFDSLSWTGQQYSDVLFRVVDGTATHDTIKVKGSFNGYHEYDPSWQGGSKLMYDNGTNGDVTAGDHIFSLSFPLVPNGGTPNFEWGAEDEAGNWLIVGGNQTFSLADTNDITVTYTIPAPTTADVTVTFRCDMQCFTTAFDSVSVAGPFNGWNGQVMADGDADGQFTLNVLFPTGSTQEQEYKFRYHVAGGTEWESVSNRLFTINDDFPTQDLGNRFYNDQVCAPNALTVYQVAGDAVLRWDGPDRANFEVFGHTATDSIVFNGTLLGTTGNQTFTVTGPLSPAQFFQVRSVLPY